MPLVLANRVQEAGTANTTVSFTLTGAVAGFQTFAVIGNTNTTYYTATDTAGNWEIGLGQYSTTGPTLTRLTFYASSAGGGPVSFPGTVTVFVTYPSGSSVYLDFSGNVSPLGTISSGNWQASTVGVAYGGTGVTTSSGPNSVVLRDANENITVNRINQGLQNTTASGGTTLLTAASDFNQQLVGTGGHTFRLPDATTLTDTTTFQFNNNATGTLTIQNNAGTAVGTVAPGGAAGIALMNNTTSGGTWDVHGYIPENVTWGTNSLALGSTVITGGTWQGGTIQSGYGGTGLTTFTGANNALYSTSASNLVAGTLPVAAGGTGLTSFTANGVVYASSSSALTTGSALTFDGTNLDLATVGAKLNFATTGSATRNYVGGSADGYSLEMVMQRGASQPISYKQDFSAAAHIYGIANSEQMRLTSTGLGIGTSSPAYKLDVAGTINSGASTATGYNLVFRTSGITTGRAQTSLTNTSGDFWTGIEGSTAGQTLTGSAAYSAFAGTFTANPLYLVTSGSIRATLDSSGNLGIGTSSPQAKLHVANSSSAVLLSQDSTTATVVGTNAAGTASQGLFLRGFPLTFTGNGGGGAEQMRLDSSGNLGIGTSSPGSRLDVNGQVRAAFASGFQVDNAGTMLGKLYYSGGLILDRAAATNLFFQQNGSTQMALNASGNLGIGTTDTSNGRLNVTAGTAATGNSLFLQNLDGTINPYLQVQHSSSGVRFVVGNSFSGANNNLIFGSTNTLNGMTLNDSGNLGLGTTPSYKLHVAGASGSELRWENTDDSNRGWRIKATTGVGVNFGTTSGIYPLLFDIDSVTKMTLDTSGNLSMAAGGAIVSSRINPRTSTTASTATLTPNIATFDQYNLTAQAVGLTVAAPTGTPLDGNRLTFRILDNGTGQTINWDGTYTAMGVTLPTTTTANKMIYVGCVYNATNTRWDVVAVTAQA